MSNQPLDLAALAAAAAAIAREAADEIMAIYAGDFDVELKADQSPVTDADMAAHRIIKAGLARLQPQLPVLSEESTRIDWAERSTWTRYWLVDPIDGTREFVKRNGQFSVNIALIENHQPILGVIQAPVTGELAYAWRGAGTWLSMPGEEAQRVHTRSLPEPPEPFVVTGSRSHRSGREVDWLQPLGTHVRMGLGSSLKFVRLAAGEADVYLRLGNTSEWDTAAGHCLLEEAGGAVLDLQGKPLRYNVTADLLNPEFLAVADRDADWSALLRP